jgi:methylene-fatty-acyl-phospholipid synthase
VDVLSKLFFGFKCIQLMVFLYWCYVHGGGSLMPAGQGVVPMGLGATLIVIGQALNFSVFYRLGKIGVFYGTKFGYAVPWCQQFPFSLLRHPQYVGAVISIWGFFMTTRFPHDDWYVLPILQTGHYILGGYVEE